MPVYNNTAAYMAELSRNDRRNNWGSSMTIHDTSISFGLESKAGRPPDTKYCSRKGPCTSITNYRHGYATQR